MRILKWQKGDIELDTQTTETDDIFISRREDGKTYLSMETDVNGIDVVVSVCLEELLNEMIEKGYLVIGLNIQ